MQILLGQQTDGSYLYQCTCGALVNRSKALGPKLQKGNCKECAPNRRNAGQGHPLYWVWLNEYKKLWPLFNDFLMDLPPWPGPKYMLNGRILGTAPSPGNVQWVLRPKVLHPITPDDMRNFRDDFYDDALKQLHKEAHLEFLGEGDTRTSFMATLADLERSGIIPADADKQQLQIELERESQRVAIDSNHRQELLNHAKGRSSQTWPARGIRMSLGPLLAQRMKEHYTNAMEKGIGTNLDVVHPLTKCVPFDVMAHITLTVTLDCLGQGTKFTTPLVKLYGDIGSRIEQQAFYEHVKQNHPKEWDQIDRWYLKDEVKGVDSKFKCSKVLVGDTTFQFMSNKEQVEVGTWAYANLQSVTGWFEHLLWRDPRQNKNQYFLGLSEDGLKYAAGIMVMKDKASFENWPMLVPPQDWKEDERGGYLKFHYTTATLVRNNHGTKEKTDPSALTLAAVNQVQKQAFCVNKFIYGVQKALMVSTHEIGAFRSYEADSYKDTHFPIIDPEIWELPRVDGQMHPDKRKARATLRNFYGQQKKAEKKRVPPERTLRVAARFYNVDEFWLPAYMDSRTRMYYMVDTLNPQGADYQKALLLLAKGNPVTMANRELIRRDLLITLANNWAGKVAGQTIKSDKLPMEERKAFGEKLLKEAGFIPAVTDPLSPSGMSFWTAADEPFQFLATLREYYEIFETCERTLAQVPNGRDASNSGMQVQGGFLRDQKMCVYTNAIETDRPMDAYEEVAKYARDIIRDKAWVNEQLDACEEAAKQNELKRREQDPEYKAKPFRKIFRIKPKQITRKTVKRAVMCTGYGASWSSKNEYVAEELDAIAGIMDENFTLAEKIIATNAIIIGQRQAFPRSDEINQWFKLLGKAVLQKSEGNNGYVRWETATGSTIVQEYRELGLHRVLTYGQGGAKYDQKMAESSGEPTDNTQRVNVANGIRGDVIERKTQTALAANWTHSQDAAIFQAAFHDFKHPFYVVHDCGYCPAGMVDDMTLKLRKAFLKVTTSPALDKLPDYNQVDIKPLEKGQVDPFKFLKSGYMFA